MKNPQGPRESPCTALPEPSGADSIGHREVDDPDDDALAVFMGLRDGALRQGREQPGGDMAGWFIAEGDRVIDRAVAAGHTMESVLVDTRRARPVPESWLPRSGVLRGSGRVLAAVGGRAELRDPIACFVRPPRDEASDVLRGSRTVLITEGVNNPTNMGAIARSAAALGVDALLVDPSSCDPLYRRCVRVSMGAVFSIPHARIGPLPAGLGPVTDAGFVVVALSPHATADISALSFAPESKVALMVGAEAPGLTDDSMGAADHVAGIPMANDVDSLNVGVAAAIACFALGRPGR